MVNVLWLGIFLHDMQRAMQLLFGKASENTKICVKSESEA